MDNQNNQENNFNQNNFNYQPAPQVPPLDQPVQPRPQPFQSEEQTLPNPITPQPQSFTQQIPTPQPVEEVVSQIITSPPEQVSTNPFDEIKMNNQYFQDHSTNNAEIPNNFYKPNPFSPFNQETPSNTFYNGNAQTSNPFQEPLPPSSNIINKTSIQNINKIKMNREKKGNNPIQIILITVVAFSMCAFMIFALAFNLKLLRISGTSMSPTMTEKDWVLSSSKSNYTYGDIVAFYHNDVIMIKRIIALPGDTVLIDSAGNVFVNNNLIEESYISSKSAGSPEIEFPHTVHPESYFVLGDNRSDSIDSRNIAIRDIKETDIVGKVSFSLIPFKNLS